tara:strand:+ start:112 stop:630 length:519 start_codon:yes stop_codon:yes gene_type:complete
MTELRFFKFNYHLAPFLLSICLVLLQVSVLISDIIFDVDFNIYKYLKDNPHFLILLIFPLILVCYNVIVIDEKGFKRVAFFIPIIRKNVKWNKIKYYAKVTEFYKKKGGINKKKAFWLIDKKGNLIFRLEEDYQYKSDKIFDVISKITDTKGLSIEVDNPYQIRNGLKKFSE